MEVVSNVINLDARRPHRSGNARCLNCKYEWGAVARPGAVTLECPKCSTFQGVFVGVAHSHFAQWQCTCGEWTFFIDAHGPYCAHCGTRPSF